MKTFSGKRKLRMHCQQLYTTINIKENSSGKKEYDTRQKLLSTQRNKEHWKWNK